MEDYKPANLKGHKGGMHRLQVSQIPQCDPSNLNRLVELVFQHTTGLFHSCFCSCKYKL